MRGYFATKNERVSGAILENFNAPSEGTYSTLDLIDVTVTSTVFLVQSGLNGEYVPPNPASDKFLVSPPKSRHVYI